MKEWWDTFLKHVLFNINVINLMLFVKFLFQNFQIDRKILFVFIVIKIHSLKIKQNKKYKIEDIEIDVWINKSCFKNLLN